MRRWGLAVLAFCILLAGETILAAAGPAGPVCDAQWRDPARERDVPLRIRMPAGTGKVPLILFSHGLGGSLEAGKIWAQAWVEAGFAVIQLRHPGSDYHVTGPALVAALNPVQLAERAHDVSFVRSALERRTSEGACDLARLDLSRVGIAGHSFGSRTALAIAGQLPPEGPSLADPRFIAAIAFSPSPPVVGADGPAFANIRIPVMALTGSADRVSFLPDITPSDRERPFYAMPPGEKYLLSLSRADHAVFAGQDDPAPGGVVPVMHVRSEVIRATTLFWRWRLLGDAGAKAGLEATGAGLPPGDRFEMR